VVCFSLVEGPEQAGGSFIDRDPTLLNVAVSRAKRSLDELPVTCLVRNHFCQPKTSISTDAEI
jgi:hypothetical protein